MDGTSTMGRTPEKSGLPSAGLYGHNTWAQCFSTFVRWRRRYCKNATIEKFLVECQKMSYFGVSV